MPPELTFGALDLFFNSHPWHGVDLGPAAPARVTVYVEIVPTDTVKYEMTRTRVC